MKSRRRAPKRSSARNNGHRPITRATPAGRLPELLLPEEAAAWLQLSRHSMYALIRTGQVKSVRLGRLVRVPRAALVELTQ